MNPSPYRAPFNSAHGRARVVMILLAVGAIAAVLSLAAEALTLVFAPLTEEQVIADNPAGLALGFVVLFLALVELVVYIGTVVAFLMWLYRANQNLRAIDPVRHIDYSSGWAVGSFFIPFVNLVVPYRAVKEVWQKSAPGEERFLSEPQPPAFFPIWWMFWLLASFAGNISMRVSFNENVDEKTAVMISIVAGVLSILAAVFAYMVVQSIDQRQEEASARLRLGKYFEPPPPPPSMPPLSPSMSANDVVAPTWPVTESSEK